MFQGEPLTDDQTLTLAVNNYRYSSALKAQGLVAGTKEWESSNSIRDMIVAYFAEHSPVAPAVDNNWKIVGVDLNEDDPRRAELIGYINDGLLDPPYAQSYNLADYDALVAQAKANAGVTVDGVAKLVPTATGADGRTYYRLRNLAAALSGTDAQFNVYWEKTVYFDAGQPYFETNKLSVESPAPDGLPLTQVSGWVGETYCTLDAVLHTTTLGGNYYVSPGPLLDALGVSWTVTDGVLAITTK